MPRTIDMLLDTIHLSWRSVAVLVLLSSAGCSHRVGLIQSTDSKVTESVELVAQSNRKPGRGTTRDRSTDSGYSGPIERALNRSKWEQEKADAVASGQAFTIEGLHEYQAAESLYHEGRFKEAEKAFKKLAKARRNSHESLTMKMERWWGVNSAASLDTYANFGDPIEEDSLFMKAECQFEQKDFATAQDSYDALITKYPSTRHLDAVSRRYFQIARYWLGFPEKAGDQGDVQLADGSDEEEVQDFENVDSFYVPIAPNLFDKTRPVFDTRGRALQALRSVWLHDATGPLADDALMVSASFHLRTKDFEESARLYKLLREQYPESPHFQDAFLLGSHVTLASYQGSNYDGQNLNEAIELKEAALRIFPDLTEEERNRLGTELQKMYDAEVARIWDRVEYYQAKQAPESVAVYCKILINRFPDSVYAARARKILERQNRSRPLLPSALPQLPGSKPEMSDNEETPRDNAESSNDAPPRAESRAPFRLPPLKWPLRKITPDANTPDAGDSNDPSSSKSESAPADDLDEQGHSDQEAGDESPRPRYQPRLEEVSTQKGRVGQAVLE